MNLTPWNINEVTKEEITLLR